MGPAAAPAAGRGGVLVLVLPLLLLLVVLLVPLLLMLLLRLLLLPLLVLHPGALHGAALRVLWLLLAGTAAQAAGPRGRELPAPLQG